MSNRMKASAITLLVIFENSFNLYSPKASAILREFSNTGLLILDY